MKGLFVLTELLEGKRDDTVIISRNSKSIFKVHRLLLMIEVIFSDAQRYVF